MNIKSGKYFLAEQEQTTKGCANNNQVAKSELSIDQKILDATRASLRASPFDRNLDPVMSNGSYSSVSHPGASSGIHKQLVKTRVQDNRVETEFVITKTLEDGGLIEIGSQFETRALEVCELVDDVGHSGAYSIDDIKEKNPLGIRRAS